MSSLHEQGSKRLKRATELDRNGQYKEAVPEYIAALEFFLAELKKDWAERLRSACQTIMTRAEELSEVVEKNKKNPAAARAAGGPAKKQEKEMTEEEREQKRQEEEENMTPEQKEMRRKLEETLVPPSNELSWNDVAGLEEAKQSLEEAVILPQKFPQLFTGNRKPWKGILLYGPPGTGKSFIAKVLSSVSGMNFFSVSASSLMSKWVGESEKMTRELFKLAIDRKPAIVFVDEIDAVLTRRGEQEHDSLRRVKTEFFIWMSRIADEDGVLVLAATNRPWDLDPAALRRFEKRIYIPLPDMLARQRLFQIHLRGETTVLSPEELHKLAAKTEGYSGADIANVCRDALMVPIRDALASHDFVKVASSPDENGQTQELYEPCKPGTPGAVHCDIFDLPADSLRLPPVLPEHIERALAGMKSSVSPSELAEFEEWTEQFGEDGATGAHSRPRTSKPKKKDEHWGSMVAFG